MKEVITLGDNVETEDGQTGTVVEIITKSFDWKPIKVLVKKGHLKGLTLAYSKKDVHLIT